MSRATSRLAFAAVTFLALAACGGGGSGSSSGDDGAPPDSPTDQPPAANSPPQISGAPVTVATVGERYEFKPHASDADGDALEFFVSNLPSWAQFDMATGRLSGTPGRGDIGNYSSITISVSDGKLSATLPAFAISVANEGSGSGSATLTWKAPKRNEDGSKLKNLAGFRVYYGQDSSNLVYHVEIPERHIKTVTIEQLTQGTWYFAVTAYTTAGLESSFSEVVSKTIR